jgi:hypothetical protein
MAVKPLMGEDNVIMDQVLARAIEFVFSAWCGPSDATMEHEGAAHGPFRPSADVIGDAG